MFQLEPNSGLLGVQDLETQGDKPHSHSNMLSPPESQTGSLPELSYLD